MTTPPLARIRNIGIISHIDAGKTTVSERILYYTGEIHKMGEVHDGEAVMDWMPQEQERGITITATASSCYWRDCRINLIDTPGHIDFTIEVERSMRVLDGGIAILSAVEGVQPQTESVWRQADRYRVPRICFINKMDRIGADFTAVLTAMESRLKARVVPVQLPLGNEADFSGVIDLLKEELVLFSDADQGMTVERLPIPPEYLEEATMARNLVVEAAADFDDAVLADYLAGVKLPAERLLPALRTATLSCSICLVFCGAALRNKGIQPLLDGVVDFLPSPSDVPPVRGLTGGGDAVTLSCDPASPLVAFAFKVLAEEGRRLTFLRIYSGSLRNGSTIFNSSRGAFERADRLFHMHAHKREQITEAAAGDIVAVTGMKKTLTGDTLCEFHHRLILDGLAVPEPVVSVAVEAKGAEDRERLPGALEKLQWEDPTFRVHEDAETGQTILTGMGELHLEIITDRLTRNMASPSRPARRGSCTGKPFASRLPGGKHSARRSMGGCRKGRCCCPFAHCRAEKVCGLFSRPRKACHYPQRCVLPLRKACAMSVHQASEPDIPLPIWKFRQWRFLSSPVSPQSWGSRLLPIAVLLWRHNKLHPLSLSR